MKSSTYERDVCFVVVRNVKSASDMMYRFSTTAHLDLAVRACPQYSAGGMGVGAVLQLCLHARTARSFFFCFGSISSSPGRVCCCMPVTALGCLSAVDPDARIGISVQKCC